MRKRISDTRSYTLTFKTAKEMFEANIFDGRSLKERWDDVVIVNIGGISVHDVKKSWFE